MTDQTAPVTPRTKPHPCVDCANDPTGRGICAEHLELAERSTAGTAETPRAEWGPCDGETCRCHWPSICPDCGCTDEREAGSTDALRAACREEVGPWFDESHEAGRFDPQVLADRIIARAALAASDAGPVLGFVNSDPNRPLDQEPVADAGPAGRTDALPTIAALGDFIASKVIGNDNWTPHGLAADILDRLSRESDR
jgi:hypothetical protein